MNGFDLAIVAVVLLSALFAFVRGIIREMIALAAWVVGFIAAIAYAGSCPACSTGSMWRRWRGRRSLSC
jgi:uncharacterized membrane protein required for colicin V production